MCNFFQKSESSKYRQKRFGFPDPYPVPVWKQFLDIRIQLQTHYPAGYPTAKPDSDHLCSRGGRSHFFRLRLHSCFKFFESGAGSVSGNIFQIWESDSCSDSGYSHRSKCNLPMFLLKKWPHRLLLLPKLKSGSGTSFSQIFDSGSERKTQNPAGADSGKPDPIPPLLCSAVFYDVLI